MTGSKVWHIFQPCEWARHKGHAVGKRAFIGVLFSCCNTYGRAYLNREGSAYVCRCPRCARPIRIGVSKDGSASRFFSAG